MAHQRIEKWRGWIDDRIKHEVVTMHLHWDTWSHVQKMLAANSALPNSYWWEFMADTYGITQAVAVRRQLDTHRDVASLGKLVAEIAEEPQIITKAFWLDLWDTTDRIDPSLADRSWHQQFGGEVGDHLDPAIPMADLDAARQASEGVRRYVDKHLAHSDRNAVPASSLPTVPELHYAIDMIGHVYKKYANLLTASSWITLVPIAQNDWMAVFREPWMRDGWES
jgi:AbiU2